MTVVTPRVLLISESRITRRVVEMTFADQQVELVAAAGGDEGLAAWRDRPAAVVVADLTAESGPDGVALARHVHAHADGRPVAVILMAGQHEAVDDALMASAGVRAVIRKPLDSMQLIEAVRGALRAERPAVAPWPPAVPVGVADPDAVAELSAALEGGAAAAALTLPEDVMMSVPVAMDLSMLAAPAPPAAVDAVAARALDDVDLERVAARAAAIWSEQAGHDQRVADATSAAAERLVRELAPALVAEVARLVVADVSERLVREEIARMRAEHASR